ncbi:MAG: MlaD family protein, partial [Acidimicrobiia bacterium]
FYRGLRVGRVHAIQLAERKGVQRSTGRERLTEKVDVTVAVNWNIDIRERSYAVFEKPFIAGASYVQIVGRVEVDEIKPKKKLGQKPYPEIREGASFLQATSTSAQELLSKAGVTVDRLNDVLSQDNINAFNDTMKNFATLSAAFAKQDSAIQATLSEWPAAIAEFRQTFDKLQSGADTVNLIAMELGPQDAATRKAMEGKQHSELYKTIEEAKTTLANINSAAAQLNVMIVDARPGIREFSNTGLTEFSQAVREVRKLTESLNIIATKLERDPAGFVFSGKQG